MPLSIAQLAMNQANAQHANAQHATGPKTPEGKRTSSQNARRHGITAQTTIMTEEDRIQHDEFCATMMADLAPIGAIETFLASSVAEEAWRLNHARAQAANIIAIGHFDGTAETYETPEHREIHPEIHTAITDARTVRDTAKTLELISLYESRIRRAFEKYLAKLETLQAERRAKHENDLEEARKFFQMAQINNIPWNPAHDNFVFSNDEIASYTDRYHRRVEARMADIKYERRTTGPKEVPKAA